MKSIVVIISLGMLFSGKGKTVLLDSYFNNEYEADASGKKKSWHYKWDEQDNGGFSLLGKVFNDHGIATQTSYERPSKELLSHADMYIIVDPDVPKENPNPNYIEEQDAQVIYDWVKEGGVLLMMANDTGNAELDHFNILAGKFGIHFNKDSRNHVDGDRFDMGAIDIKGNNPVLKTAKKIYLKEICTIGIKTPARAVLTDKGDIIMASAKIGKGTVFAVGDPWLYNEYTDGKKLPAGYQNYEAANDLVKWLAGRITPQH